MHRYQVYRLCRMSPKRLHTVKTSLTMPLYVHRHAGRAYMPSSCERTSTPRPALCGRRYRTDRIHIGVPHRIWRHDAQVKLLARDLAKAARHPVVEESPVGRHRERPDIRALGRSGGTELFDVTICHPLSQARIRNVVKNPLNLLKAAWTAKVSRYASVLQAAGTGFNLLPVPLSTLGGWHPGAHKALCSVASTIAARFFT